MTDNKEFKKFEKNLNSILSSSAGAGSWSDLLPFTRDIHQLLEKKKTEFNFAILSDRNILAKRLAQCLNPECPGGVHEVAIKIYNILFQNILSKNKGKLEDNLGIYCSGLFPFFSYASIPNKLLFLENIVISCFLKLDQNELNLCLPGLLSSLIPGLDDNKETTSQKIYSAFDEIRKMMKKGAFYGTYWSLLLKNKSLRPSGIKYLYEKIIKYNEYEALNDEKKKEILEDEFPNINNLVVNSLSQLIEEQDIPTVRTAMDFIILRIPLTKENTMLNDKAKITLLISALKLLIKNEYSTSRRLSNWLLGTGITDDEIDLESPDVIYKMDLLVQAFKIMFNSQKLINSENLKDYVKILDQFFVQNIDFSDFILSKISYDLIICFANFWQTELNSSEYVHKNDTIKKLNSFFIKDNSYLECLWKSIGTYFDSVQETIPLQTEKDILSNYKSLEKILFPILQHLKFCFLYLELQSNADRVKYYIPILNNLLKIINKYNALNRDTIQKIRHVLFTTLVFTQSIQSKNTQNSNLILTASTSEKNMQVNIPLLQRKISLFTQLKEGNENEIFGEKEVYDLSEESSLQNILKNKENEKIMNSLTETISNYQDTYIKILGQFLLILNKTQIAKNEITVFRNLTELMIRLQEYSQNKELPEWVKYLEKIIFNKDVNIKLSLDAANCLLNLNLSSFNDHEIYKIIKNNFLEGEIDSSIIDTDYLNEIVTKTGVNKTYRELLIGKLYLIINDQSNQKFIIDLLVKISKLDQNKFISILENTFSLEDSIKESVKLFSDFWQLLNEYYNDIFFFKKGECVFKMIDYLDDQNPLLRHLSKSWLDESTKQFKKIIDPILLVLLDQNIIINEYKQDFYIEKEYDTKKIMDSFHKLKSLILNSSIMQFLVINKPNEEILFMFKKKNNYRLELLEMTYLHILISISLKFTQGKSKDELNESFKKENSSINSTSCEFLEFLLSHINNPETIMEYAKIINLPIIKLIDKAIDNNNEVMQLQLLSVLRVLYFKTSPIHLKHKNDTFNLFNNLSLINCLINGMTRDIYFVRENFINFTRECLPFFKKVMNEEKNKEAYYKFGEFFTDSLTKFLSKRITISLKGRKDTERFSHFDDTNNVNFFIFKNYLDEYKEYKFYDESDVLLILKGIKDITFHFLNINPNPNPKKDNNFWPDFKDKLVESQKIPSGFLFVLFGVDEDKKDNLDINIKKFFNSQIMNLLNSLLLTWINKSNKYEPYDFCLNDNGIFPYKKVNKEIFNDQEIREGLESIKKNPVKKIVRDLAINLFYIFPIEFMEAIIKIWCFSCKKKSKNIEISLDAQYKLTIIEFLISLDIPLNIILYCINVLIQRSIRAEKEKEKRGEYIKYVKENKVFNIPYKTGVFEAKLIHFLYSYILLNPFIDIPYVIYNKEEVRNEISESWREMINFLNTIISDTKIIYTFCWIYELLEVSLIKVNIEKCIDQTVKSKLIDLFNIITEKLTNCVFNNKTDSSQLKDGRPILPYLPCMYLNIVKQIYPEFELYLYNKATDSGQNQNINTQNNIIENQTNIPDQSLSTGINSKVNDFFDEYFSAVKLCSERINLSAIPLQPKELCNTFYRQIACITLKENFYKILHNMYDDPSLYRKNLYEIIRQLINLLKTNSQKKDSNSMFYAEFASNFLYTLMRDCPSQVTLCGKSLIMDYLNDPTFFVTTPKILRNLRKTISLFVRYYPEIISELIRNINAGFLFIGGNDEDKIKILRRISFVIYSCQKDTFQKDFDNIKENAKYFLTGYKDNSELEREIFLMMRILFLRFSHEGVMKMIKDLWPIIFTELIENIKEKKRNKQISLVIESFKFIELLSLANVEEFSLYQWIFILDTFNMKDLDTRNPESLLSEILKKESKVFRPIALDILNKDNLIVNDEIIQGKNKGKSELLVCPVRETLADLQKALKQFFYSIGDMNTYKVELNYDQIEDVIEKDFLDNGVMKK